MRSGASIHACPARRRSTPDTAASSAKSTPAPAAQTDLVFIAGVGQLYQGDLDAGRIVIERLERDGLPSGVTAEDCYYGAIAVCQRIEELRPELLILVGAAHRGRAPGTVRRFEVAHLARPPEEFQHAVAEAATGYVSIDLILEVTSAFRALPSRTVVLEIEPQATGPSEALSDVVEAAVEETVRIVRREITPLPARLQ